MLGGPVVSMPKQLCKRAENDALANRARSASQLSGLWLFRYAAPEVYVHIADMIAQPLVNGVYELPGVRTIKTVFRITLLKPGQVFEEPRVGSLVFLCYRTTVFVHAPLFKTKVATAIKFEVVEHQRVDVSTQTCVQSSTKVFRHPEDHLVILINTVDSGGVLVSPFHLGVPGLPYTNAHMITKTGVELWLQSRMPGRPAFMRPLDFGGRPQCGSG